MADGVPEPTWWRRPSKLGLLASGGAPNLHLVSGALCAFYKAEKSFDVIGASGAGAVAALLYAVPKQPGGQVDALQQTVNINVSDAIYQLLPMNYKAFFKRGPFAEPFWRFGQKIPHRELKPEDRYHDTLARLYNDSIDFMIAALTPTTLNYFSKSVCTRVGVIDDWIDWTGLKTYPKQFYLNAFDLNRQQLRLFGNKDLTPETFWAALAMPWLFEPTAAGADLYTEGASHDPSGLEALWEFAGAEANALDKIIALDTVGPDLWNNPQNIYDALQLAIIDPIVALAETVLAAYARLEYAVNESGSGRRLPKLYHVPFVVPDWEAPHILEWSYSNALTLWNVGHDAGAKFAAALGDDAELESYRYYNQKKGTPRTADLLKLFDEVLDARFPFDRRDDPHG
jgi:NTE family protein